LIVAHGSEEQDYVPDQTSTSGDKEPASDSSWS